MGRTLNKLTMTQVRSNKKVGKLSDGGGLYMRTRDSGTKTWIFISKQSGRNRQLQLGKVGIMTLGEAREAASRMREKVERGESLEPKREINYDVTFKECVTAFLDTKSVGWQNEKHIGQWYSTLDTYAKPIHRLQVSEISTKDIFHILNPIWMTKHETASRLRGRIEAVLDYGKAMGWREGDNPAQWRGALKPLLPHFSKARNVKHHAALEYTRVADFVKELYNREATVALLLEFIILTACRSGEARFSKWEEVDFDNRVWVIPAERMKMGKEHTVPLSDRAYEILWNLSKLQFGNYIFSHPTKRDAFSVNATRMLIQRIHGYPKMTTHGFRSTFRDWAGDETLHQRETIESALAHSLKDRAEAAYRRSTALAKRRALMQDWADYTQGIESPEWRAKPKIKTAPQVSKPLVSAQHQQAKVTTLEDVMSELQEAQFGTEPIVSDEEEDMSFVRLMTG